MSLGNCAKLQLVVRLHDLAPDVTVEVSLSWIWGSFLRIWMRVFPFLFAPAPALEPVMIVIQ
jgi:hypothetical protein